jgi:GT2 family glycosyltransferase
MNVQQTLPTVGIVIPCYQEKYYIEKCIRSCIEQSYQGTIQVAVVDGGSTDGTVEIIRKIESEFPNQIVLKNNPLKVTPVSLNIGLQHLQTDLKMILGAHSYLRSDYVSKSVAAFDSNKQVECVGGIIINEYQDKTSRNIGLAMSSPFGVGNATFRTGGKKGLVDTVAFGMYKKEVFENIGYFNEHLIRNQDDEFNFRLTQNQRKILFDPEIISHYYARGNYNKLFRQYFQYGFWKVYVNVLHHSVTSIPVQILFSVLRAGVVIEGTGSSMHARVRPLNGPRLWILGAGGRWFLQDRQWYDNIRRTASGGVAFAPYTIPEASLMEPAVWVFGR